MKKQLAAAILASVTLAVAAPAFAAANPFVDVPAKHWAYDAVTTLAAAGIVDGYGDGTFRGDKTMTRYEMAQIVAKALAKDTKTTPAQKAALEKLTQEFGDELKNLGVRVAALEAATKPNVTWGGQVRFQSSQDLDNDDTDELTNKLRLRLSAKAKVNEDTTVGFRLAAESTFSDMDNAADPDADESWNPKLDHLYVATKLGGWNVTAGRADYWLGQGGLNGDNIVTGAQFSKGKFTAVAGREWGGDFDFYAASVAGIPVGGTKLGLVYLADQEEADYARQYNIMGADLTFDLGKIGVTAQYSKNTEVAGDPDGYRVDAKLNSHWNVGYQNIEKSAINDPGTTLDVASNYKGWDLTYTNDWAKNVDFELKYWDMEAKAADATTTPVTAAGDENQTIRARVMVKF